MPRPSKSKRPNEMPGLTVDTSPAKAPILPPNHSQSQISRDRPSPKDNSRSNSRSASPVRPPYSPITPTLSSARLATSTSSSASQNGAPPQRQTYTHSQPSQTTIPQPAPVRIVFDSNPDALALKSAISILQIQARNATNDIQKLQRIKERALENPEAFAKAVKDGELKSKPDPLFNPSKDSDDEEDDEEEEEEEEEGKGEKMNVDRKAWEKLPTPQNVVRSPPINWNQYAVVGESLDKLHKDQVSRPSEGMPQKVGSDGQLLFGGEGKRREADLGVAAPYQPGRDKIEKTNTKKGKR